MAEEQKNSSAETVDAAASAAHTVKGAIKAGKAISGAAKGAAAGTILEPQKVLPPAATMGLWLGPSGPAESTSAKSLPSLPFCFCCLSFSS